MIVFKNDVTCTNMITFLESSRIYMYTPSNNLDERLEHVAVMSPTFKVLHALHDDLLSLIGAPTELYRNVQHQARQLHLRFTEVHEHRIHHTLKLVYILVALQHHLEQLSQRSQYEDLSSNRTDTYLSKSEEMSVVAFSKYL